MNLIRELESRWALGYLSFQLYRRKRKARIAYARVNHLWETYDCGRHMINFFTKGALDYWEEQFNIAMEEVEEFEDVLTRLRYCRRRGEYVSLR